MTDLIRDSARTHMARYPNRRTPNGNARSGRKNVVITGAAAGIGRATALAFAARGAHIFVSDIDLERLAPVVVAVRALGVRCDPFATDVSDETSMRQFADGVHAVVPAADILVNNAGVAWLGAFMDSPLASWKRIMGINLMGGWCTVATSSCRTCAAPAAHAMCST